MHHQSPQLHIHVKINAQIYSNLIPNDFEPMISHQVSIS